jgi:hypothetical protein
MKSTTTRATGDINGKRNNRKEKTNEEITREEKVR